KSGSVQVAGSVERGSAVSDFDPLERAWQHSLRASVLHLETQGTRVHMIDTPGFPDFIGQSIGALDAVETAAVVINASSGIEMIASRMMDWAAQRKLCRLVVVNKIDAENVDLPSLLSAIQATFGKECLPINLPSDNGRRVVDCFFNPAGESDFSSVAEAHRALVDQVVEVDEALMSLYLEQGEISPDQLHSPFEKALREGHLVPVCFVSARNGAGVAERLDMFVKLLRNPGGGNPRWFINGEGEDLVEVRVSPSGTRRGPHPHASARVPDADAGCRAGAEKARRRAENLGGAASADGGGPDLGGRARSEQQRDRAARAGRVASALGPRAHGDTVQAGD